MEVYNEFQNNNIKIRFLSGYVILGIVSLLLLIQHNENIP